MAAMAMAVVVLPAPSAALAATVAITGVSEFGLRQQRQGWRDIGEPADRREHLAPRRRLLGASLAGRFPIRGAVSCLLHTVLPGWDRRKMPGNNTAQARAVAGSVNDHTW